MSPRPLLVPVALLVAGLAVGYHLGASAPAAAARQAPKPETYTMANRLGANLWMQTAAEYRACCLQTYTLAARRLEQLVAVPNPPAKPAVIMDLDETVLDNGAFESALYAAGKEYQQPLWDVYEEKHPDEVRLVPGAKGFIERAGQLGVTVVFVSNRSAEPKSRAGTVAALTRLGVAGGGLDGRLLLRTTTSDKSARREEVAAKYTVVMLFGDNLRDFSEVFLRQKPPPGAGVEGLRKAIAAREKAADDAAAHWGTDWFVLPNPVYGEWDQMFGTDQKLALDPRDFLRPTKIELP